MMPAAKHFDPVLGVDVHIIQPPGPVPPVPVPHPFVGFLFDPFDYAPIIGATIMVNGVPRAIAGTAGRTVPGVHFPIGGVFVKPPANECEMFMGSSTVDFDGDAASYMALPALSCQCIGMVAPFRKKKKGKIKSLVAPFSVVLPIPTGPPVIIGGPPTISLMALGTKLGMAGLGKGLKKLRALQKSSKRWKAISQRAQKAANKVLDHVPGGDKVRNAVNRAICSVTGHPVDVATGKVFAEGLDFQLPGPLPLRWERVWYSTSIYSGPLGSGWHHSYDLSVTVYEEGLLVRLPDGRLAPFSHPEGNAPSRNLQEKLSLERTASGYRVRDMAGLSYDFEPASNQADRLLLSRISDRNGNSIEFVRDKERLTNIVDSARRRLDVQTDASGRIVRIDCPHPDRVDGREVLVSYTYDEEGRLLSASDALGSASRYAYQGPLLSRETDKNGFSFYFEYDGPDEDARCVRTWGDNGIYERRLAYDLASKSTKVYDSRGGTTTYYWNDPGLVIREIDALGAETHTEWDEYGNRLSVTDANGGKTSWEYDELGRFVAVTDPLGQRRELIFDDSGNAAAFVAANGKVWRREYDVRGNVTAVIDPLGARTSYEVDDKGQLVRVTDPLGNAVRMAYNDSGRIVEQVDRDGVRTRFDYDRKGRLVRRRNGLGQELQLWWTLANRIAGFTDEAGRTSKLTYDASGNLVTSENAAGSMRRYRYGPLNLLTAIQEHSGSITTYRYDTEAQLTAVSDDSGRSWIFERDLTGRVIRETTPDGRVFRYQYDGAGRRTATFRNSGQKVEFRWDALGRLLERHFPDGELERFEYSPQGSLAKASNRDASLSWEYDAIGRVVVEAVNGRTVSSRYDLAGNRLTVECDLIQPLTWEYDPEQRLRSVGAGGRELLRFGYDGLGRESVRQMPGGATLQTTHSAGGEVVERQIVSGSRPLRSRRYSYDAAGLPEKVEDSYFGTTRFHHDGDGHLLGAAYADHSIEKFERDLAAGWLTTGSTLDGSAVRRDLDGQVIEKRRGNEIQRFEYDGAGRLRSVERNGCRVAEFRYDPLGRRIAKATDGSAVGYLWDRDVPLCSYSGDPEANSHAMEQYLFSPSGFEPLGLLNGGGGLFFECDQVGMPRAATNLAGEIAWQADFTAYGSARRDVNGPVWVGARFPGQMEDRETGLCYNRYRYYDPELKTYLSPDPIGLYGGPNPYSYTISPVAWTDPYGLAAGSKCVPTDLHANGNATRPRPPRIEGHNTKPGQTPDLVPDADGKVGPHTPGGASTFGDPAQSGLQSGKWHKLPAGTELPDGLEVKPDGIDVDPTSTHPPTHHTIYPTKEMTPQEFEDLYNGLPWEKAT
jgi:RHS repeat-associated protein